jgi:hypothetical protein
MWSCISPAWATSSGRCDGLAAGEVGCSRTNARLVGLPLIMTRSALLPLVCRLGRRTALPDPTEGEATMLFDHRCPAAARDS